MILPVRTFAAIIAVAGALLLSAAFYSAKLIPAKAEDDLIEIQKANGYLSMPGVQGTLVAMSEWEMNVQWRLLRNSYVGAAGLILLFVGFQSLCRRRKDQNAGGGL